MAIFLFRFSDDWGSRHGLPCPSYYMNCRNCSVPGDDWVLLTKVSRPPTQAWTEVLGFHNPLFACFLSCSGSNVFGLAEAYVYWGQYSTDSSAVLICRRLTVTLRIIFNWVSGQTMTLLNWHKHLTIIKIKENALREIIKSNGGLQCTESLPISLS